MSAWQKIETAPKDGRIIILGSNHPGYQSIPAIWSASHDRWEWPVSDRPIKSYFATHWQPLPEAPSHD